MTGARPDPQVGPWPAAGRAARGLHQLAWPALASGWQSICDASAARWPAVGAHRLHGGAFHLKQIYLWPSQASPQVEPARLDAIAAEVRQRRLPAVFCESTFDDRQQRQLAQQAGARFGGTLYTDSLSGLDGLAPSYIELLRHNADLIKRGLSRGGEATPG